MNAVSAMQALKTAEDKQTILKHRLQQQKALGAQIDRVLAIADAEQPGCGVCRIWRYLVGTRRTTALAPATDASTAKRSASGATGAQARLFGMKKADPHVKLAEAAATMEKRIQELELRAESERAEAKRQMHLGQKAGAMRMLKKSKATEKQLEANQASLLAVEQQVDLMAQAQMQKEIASALSSSSRGMKAQKKLLKNAESAVDDAQDARDMADDLGNVMAEFANSGNADEDELLAELQQMVGDEPPANAAEASSLVESAEANAKAVEIARLEARIARYDESVAKRRLVEKMPAAPTRPVESAMEIQSQATQEKQHLLRSGSSV